MRATHRRWWVESDQSQNRIALRSLYREVAKRVHPDLTSDEADRSHRERLMAEANRAYEQGDALWLRRILEEYEVRAASDRRAGVPADLMRAVRQTTLKVRLQLTFNERFGNDRMKSHRSRLARHFLAAPHSKIQEPEELINFFEEMYVFLQGRYLNEELTWSTFGFSAVRWWAVCKTHVIEERTRKNDQTLFSGFEDLAARFSQRDAQAGLQQPTSADLKAFLEGERNLAMTQSESVMDEVCQRESGGNYE